jgi:predicted N-acetyltransferase YhbS
MCVSLITLLTAIGAGTLAGLGTQAYFNKIGFKPTNYLARLRNHYSSQIMTVNR